MKRTLTAVTAFAVAFGFVEAAVVVYLRLRFYPEGFSFPLVEIPADIALTEIARELATIIMLGAVAWVSAHRPLARFAYFALAFGVWDIFYYVFLKLLLDWPASMFTWDVLFLIPLPWLGPVLAPVIISLCLIASSVIILRREESGRPIVIGRSHWAVASIGGALVLWSFLANADTVVRHGPPGSFNWLLFGVGVCVGLAGFGRALRERPRVEHHAKAG